MVFLSLVNLCLCATVVRLLKNITNLEENSKRSFGAELQDMIQLSKELRIMLNYGSTWKPLLDF